MRNLLLKSLVLTGVIGGSCFIVWLANENLQKTQSQTDPNLFVSVEHSGDAPEVVEETPTEVLPEKSPSFESMGNSEVTSTIPPQFEEDEIQPTLAQNHQYHSLDSSPEKEELLPQPRELNVQPDAFVSIPDEKPAISPGHFPEETSQPELPEIAAAPVMPLTFYSAGGNNVPRVEMALNPQTEEIQGPGEQQEAPSITPELPSQDEQSLALSETPGLRFGPATKPNVEAATPVLPIQEDQEGGMVKLSAPTTGTTTLASTINSEANSDSEQEDGIHPEALPMLPILKATDSENVAVNSTIPSEPAPVEDNPFAKFANAPAPNPTIVQVNSESESANGSENPFAKFQNPPVQTAAMELVEPSELGFSSPPPQPSVPVVAEDPFGTNENSTEILPAANTELANNQPVPEELLPPLQPESPVLPTQEIPSPATFPTTPRSTEVPAASDLSAFPSTDPVMPVLAEPVPLPTAAAMPVENEVTPLGGPPRETTPLETQPEEPPAFTTNTIPLQTPPAIPETSFDTIETDEVTPTAGITIGPRPEINPTEVVPFELNNEPPPASANMTPREQPTSFPPRTVADTSHSTSPVQAGRKIFQDPAGDTSATLDPTISSNPQSPELKIEKIAPQQASIGDPLIYAIRIHNIGGSDARSVVVEDRIPKGTRLEGTIPQAVLVNDKLTWELGVLPPGEQRTIQLKVIPLQAGDIGSVATVSFEAAVAATIRVTAPELSVDIDGPSETLLGKNVPYKFTVKNTGQGAAKDVVLRAILPPSLKHPNGNDIEANLSDIPAGESRVVDLVVVADDVGVFTPKVLIWMNGKDVAENRADLRILESRIHLSRTGPQRRFVGRPAQFTTQIRNDSSVVLTNLTIEEQLPISLDPANPDAGWNAQKRTIQRMIPVLQPGETKQFTSQLIPKQAGELAGNVVVYDQAGNRADMKTPLSVKGFADLAVDIHRENNNVPVGDQVSFRLNLKNGGTATANQVQAEFEIPQGLVFAAATGPSAYHVVGNKVQFDPISEIPINSEKSYDIVLTAAEVCNTKVKIALHSAEYSEPINREEAVRVVSDAP